MFSFKCLYICSILDVKMGEADGTPICESVLQQVLWKQDTRAVREEEEEEVKQSLKISLLCSLSSTEIWVWELLENTRSFAWIVINRIFNITCLYF